MRKTLLALLSLCGVASAMYQYDDYPVADYDYRHNRIAISPLKLFGGIDPELIRKGPQSHFSGLPGIDRLTLSYERLTGVQGSFGFGPIVTIQPVDIGGDKAFTGISGGGFFRYYSGITQATYFQMSAEYMMVTGAKFGAGDPAQGATYDGDETLEIGGPQISPVVGYCFLFDKKWFVNVQAGYTLGFYSVAYEGGSAVDNTLPYGDLTNIDPATGSSTAGQAAYKTEGKGYYADEWRFGSYLHGAVELGFAF
ncbi:MAG: hypothetical protein RL318_971 [Fibrobacterota bacterium]|jgi:hypothetical protein